ncbi:hypothetical protein HC026_09430 [Lactobacillus sp. LC28-10]|uniref:HTH cro/C1-type domain-containing protein n=1 Tax=Secundilactobacillus angelensis TaxID=2722706 RepID=A0ABX1L480_9LACO|nr:hypothetical protein [Secundilactobacillus angelensis]MCH5462639.1 hypothetical protein [Secundilactobacillus angelensis]NLR19131.1 hypothetical protein [Secundilactobacillus angelensis]
MLNRINLTRYYHETAHSDSLQAIMPFYQIGFDKMAQQLGISTQRMLELLSHKRHLTTMMAQQIECSSGLSAELLLKLDADYQRSATKFSRCQ